MEHKLYLSNLRHTWIFDIDGTICKHNGYKLDGKDTLLEGALTFLQSIPPEDMIIFLTSRMEGQREFTESFLRENGIRYDHIIFGAPYGERILINDAKPGGLITSYAISTERDTWCDLAVEKLHE